MNWKLGWIVLAATGMLACGVAREIQGGGDVYGGCTSCHGDPSRSGSSLLKAAPPRGTAGETASTDRAVGAHERHLSGGSVGNAVACAECHEVPTDLSHLDGTPAVRFGPSASRDTTPTWDGTSCAVYCHGATLAGGTNPTPSWTGGAAEAACGTCHGTPPPAPHTSSTACGGCHDGYGPAAVNLTLHVNGTVDLLPGVGHPAGWANPEQHGYQVNRTGLSSCKACHGADLTGGSGPSCGTCHPGGTAWSASCTFCHGDPVAAEPAPPVDTQGRSATSNVSVGAHAAHRGTALMLTPECVECHPDRAGSDVITDAAHVDGDGRAEVVFGALATTGGAPATYTRTSDTSASCASTYCHGRFAGGAGSGAGATMSWTSTTSVTCGSCHGAPPTTGHHSLHVVQRGYGCGECHPGYSASTVSAATHVDGAKEVGNKITSYDASTRTCTNACHGSKTW